jgi:TMEM151 family
MKGIIILLIQGLSCCICHELSSEGSLSGSAPVWKDTMMQRIGARVMGESALMDKETGRVFWEGGSKTSLYAGINPILSEIGLFRIKSAILSIGFWVCWLSILSQNLQFKFRNFPRSLTWSTTVILGVVNWTLFKIPELDNWFVFLIMVLYFWEAYYSNTRRYLSNIISAPKEIEDVMERLRLESPIVNWKISCFHYEPSVLASIFAPFALAWKIIRRDMSGTTSSSPTKHSILTKKVVTHLAEAKYEYKECIDNTIAGVWRRANLSTKIPPFTKIKLTKLLVLSNNKACQDYFQQQSKFLAKEGQSDEFVEFSTDIWLQGFKSQILAVRKNSGMNSTRFFCLQSFWFCTFIGLTLPYRFFFSRQCDDLRVTIAKESFSESSLTQSKSWFLKAQTPQRDSNYIETMQTLSLYPNYEEKTNEELHSLQSLNNSVSINSLGINQDLKQPAFGNTIQNPSQLGDAQFPKEIPKNCNLSESLPRCDSMNSNVGNSTF